NEEMYDNMAYLENRLRDTDILQEYFVPYDRMPEFLDGLRHVVRSNGANLINVTIRTVHKDDVTALPYAKQNMFGFVLYFNVKFNEKDNEILRKTTIDLIDVAQKTGGTYYLPYQLFYSPEQLRNANTIRPASSRTSFTRSTVTSPAGSAFSASISARFASWEATLALPFGLLCAVFGPPIWDQGERRNRSNEENASMKLTKRRSFELGHRIRRTKVEHWLLLALAALLYLAASMEGQAQSGASPASAATAPQIRDSEPVEPNYELAARFMPDKVG